MTKDEKLIMLIRTLGADEAMKLAPTLTDDEAKGGNAAEEKTADEAAAVAKAANSNPFAKGPHFSLKEQGRLYRDEKTRKLAIGLAKAAGITLKDEPNRYDTHGTNYRAP